MDYIEFTKEHFETFAPKQATDEFFCDGWVPVPHANTPFALLTVYRRLRSLCSQEQIEAIEGKVPASNPAVVTKAESFEHWESGIAMSDSIKIIFERYRPALMNAFNAGQQAAAIPRDERIRESENRIAKAVDIMGEIVAYGTCDCDRGALMDKCVVCECEDFVDGKPGPMELAKRLAESKSRIHQLEADAAAMKTALNDLKSFLDSSPYMDTPLHIIRNKVDAALAADGKGEK